MITFQNSELLWLLILLTPLLYLLKSKPNSLEMFFSKEVLKKIQLKNSSRSKIWRNILLMMAITLTIIALSRPQIDKGEITIKSSCINVVTAIDMSKSMFANDVYPNRFEFAKKKFFDALDHFENTNMALMGFSSATFLISPLTQDFHSLKFLAKNLNLKHLNLEGTNIMTTLKSANTLFGTQKRKILLLFTDGGDQRLFAKEIAYCKSHNISVHIYNIGTQKGGTIREEKGLLKDKWGEVVVVKRTDNIKKLALESGGTYMKYAFTSNDIKLLAQTILHQHKATKEKQTLIKDRKELFYYPLSLAILLLFMALFSIPTKKETK